METLLAILHVSYLVIVLVILFGLTIFVHELGHFLVALRCGMVIDTFSIGFGPAIWKRRRNGITYKIGWIPIGGYVALPQLDPAAMELIQGKDKAGGKPEDKPGLPWISPWKKILVSLAGASFNVLFGVLLAWVVYVSPGVIPEETSAVLGMVKPASGAWEAGLRPGDEILAVNGSPVKTWNDFTIECHLVSGRDHKVMLTVRSDEEVKDIEVATAENSSEIQVIDGIDRAHVCQVGGLLDGSPAEDAGLLQRDIVRQFNGTRVLDSEHLVELVSECGEATTTIVVERDGKLLEMPITPKHDGKYDRAMIGIMFGEIYVLPWMQYKKPWDQIKHDAKSIFRILRALTSRREGEARRAAGALGGPPAIIFMLWNAISISLLNAIGFIRFLNINLAILNLLPIPVLDGGHIVFALWEGLTRRRVHPRVINILVNVFAVLIIGVILIISVRDFIRLPKWMRLGEASESVIEQKDE